MSLFTTYLPYFVLVLTLLVFVHEYGHYWVGRRFGIHAEVFSIGFGPELIGWTDRNGTRWKISAVPLGGYVKFLGDSDATSATPSGEPLTPEQSKRAFFSQPLYARAAVVLGGPLANLIFAFVVLTAVFFVAGEPYTPTTVGDECVIGHKVHLEGCIVHNGALIGSGSVVLHNAVVEAGALVGAGAVVTNNMVVPAGAMALGIPAKIREGAANPDEIMMGMLSYVERSKRYRTDLRRLD